MLNFIKHQIDNIRIMWNNHSPNSNLYKHAKQELELAGYFNGDIDEYMANNLLEIIGVFSKQGHSGFSASFATSMLEKLLRYEPITPLTGSDDEWVEHAYCDDFYYQNKRDGKIFKDVHGNAYNMDGKVFRDQNGSCYTNSDSRVYITFPYTPTTEYVDVVEDEN